MNDPPGQVRTEVPVPAGGAARTVISAGRDVELDARSMLLLAEGVFRLDVVPHEDTIQTLVRSLRPGHRAELRSGGEVGGEGRSSGPPGEVAPRSMSRFGGEVVLVGEDGAEETVARILVGSICHLDRGLTSVTAQATLV